MIIFADREFETYSEGKTIPKPAAILADFEQRDLAFALSGIDTRSIFPDPESQTIRFESRNKYDYFAVHIPESIFSKKETELIEIYLTQEFLVVLGQNPILQSWQKSLVSGPLENLTTGQMLSLLFNQILSQDLELLDQIEDRIEELEEDATLKNPNDHTNIIITLRKQLLALKRYFQAWYESLEELEENQNNLFSTDQLKIFRAQKNKAGRLLNTVLNLRDYLTQVREAYQNQLDISLNDTMRFFTVVTSIFLPLNLIVGWYGMNLKMPELAYKGTYIIVILVSISFIVFSLIYGKKKGWF
ncbi:MAG: magnesium transporter [Fastidiosipila sp.]|nr:magnesium transporter [Fastidiosipila sp.]